MKTQKRPSLRKHPGGRPRKFAEPSHPITVTLPERTLAQLAAIDRDRARAIVRATDTASPSHLPSKKLVEVIEVAAGTGMLVVPPSRFLRTIPDLRLIEVAPSRYLLAMPSGMAPSLLELALQDMLDEVPAHEERERAILTQLHEQVRKLRRADQMSTAEVLFVSQ